MAGEVEFKSRLRPRRKWAVLISGRGSNLAALIEMRDEIDLRMVLSSDARAYGLIRARRAGIRCGVIPFAPAVDGKKPKIDWGLLSSMLSRAGITHLFLAGFMKVVPASFVSEWAGRIVNLHPSLLPSYPGLHSIDRAITDRAAVGISVHEVVADVDAGPMICQRTVLSSSKVSELVDARADSAILKFLVHVQEQRIVKEAALRWKTS